MLAALQQFDALKCRVIIKNTFLTIEELPSVRWKIHSDSSALTSVSATAWVEPLHRVDYPTLLRREHDCCHEVSIKDGLLTAPKLLDCSSIDNLEDLKRTRRRGQPKQLRVGQFIGVKCSGCIRVDCTTTSKKTGSSYQKCHCEIKQVKGTQLLIHHVANSDVDDQWMEKADPRIVRSKDEKWCSHGRLCNHTVRGHICKYGNDCLFCHDASCAGCIN